MEDATVITDQKDIIRKQDRFYEKLYTSRKTQFKEDHSTTFFNHDYIRGKLTPEEKESCESNSCAKKCLDALKVIGDGKSPGMDGFTVEFYNFFWNDLSHYLERSVNRQYSYSRRSWDECPLGMNARLTWGKVKETCNVYVVISSSLRENTETSLPCLQLYQQRGKGKGPSQIPRSCKCYFSLFSVSWNE